MFAFQFSHHLFSPSPDFLWLLDNRGIVSSTTISYFVHTALRVGAPTSLPILSFRKQHLFTPTAALENHPFIHIYYHQHVIHKAGLELWWCGSSFGSLLALVVYVTVKNWIFGCSIKTALPSSDGSCHTTASQPWITHRRALNRYGTYYRTFQGPSACSSPFEKRWSPGSLQIGLLTKFFKLGTIKHSPPMRYVLSVNSSERVRLCPCWMRPRQHLDQNIHFLFFTKNSANCT